ncbi:MAG: hypothetical protein Q4D12_08105 [Bacteroidales bacterium]|nr:hypothetical protein [Bacteroidales bacterium]
MKKTFLALSLAGACMQLNAQEISFRLASGENPVVNADHSVTFTFQAPNTARIEIEAPFLPQREIV